ncbi:MAG: zinc dependent phospholipase C family protein [Deltaproteobacteria bacterium]|nr:zinc dependent phospholipase C family protein [Deltaproteobacteria bacterium]
MPFFLTVVAFLLLLPVPALAFGPVAHVDMGLDILAHAGGLAAGLGALLNHHRREFLQGILGPDRVVAKNLAPYAWHSHNWKRAFDNLKEARDEAERAALLGWICHLAADVVAHNFYVPAKMTESYGSPMAQHAYWEMRFDARFRHRIGPLGLRKIGFSEREHLLFLKRVMPASVLGKRLNIGLTGLALKVQEGKAYTRLGNFLDRRSRLPLSQSESDEVRQMAMSAQLDVLSRMAESKVVDLDPRGIKSLKMGRRMRSQLRFMDIHRPASTPDIIRLTFAANRRLRETVESSLAA